MVDAALFLVYMYGWEHWPLFELISAVVPALEHICRV